MGGQWKRGMAYGVLVAALAGGAAGCSDGSGTASDVASDVASRAASAAASVGGRVTDAASSAASRASSAVASATAAAEQKLNGVKDGVNAKDEVKLSAPTTDGGRTTTRITVDNTADATKSFAVQVNFTDGGGNLLDTVVVTVSDVAAGKSGTATARSNRTLSGEVKTEIGTALRY